MKQFATLGLTVLLAACGGGGGGGVQPPATAPVSTPISTAEGLWEGTASTGSSVALALLETGETWGVYTSNGLITGALYGNTASSGTTLSGAGRDFNIPSRSVGSGSYTGTFVEKSSIRVATSSGSTFSGAYITTYDQPALLATLAGTFSGQGVSGTSAAQTVSVTISSSGAVTTPASPGCSASGSAKPRASGKNIFDVTLTFTGSACALGNGASTTGIVHYSATTRRIVMMALNTTKSDGFIYVGQKL